MTFDKLAMANLTIVGVALLIAATRPRLAAATLRKGDRCFSRLARRRGLAIGISAALPILVRLAILPIAGVPYPHVHDEFSYLLASDTFASGRVANPTHPLWQHFESMHIIHEPTYVSKYPPLPGMFMALGQVTTGSPWAGVLLGVAAMCGGICWMLQGWLPPKWGLLGGILAGMRLGVSGYWVDSYWGGAWGAFGGALLIGALPRIKRRSKVRDAVALALGVAILANSRPFEGMALSLAVGLALLWWMIRLDRRALRAALRRFVLPATAILVAVASAMAYYNGRTTGYATRMPYMVHQDTYQVYPIFLWQSAVAPPVYRHLMMRRTFEFDSAGANPYLFSKTWGSLVDSSWYAAVKTATILGPVLLLPLLYFPWILRDRRMRFILFASALVAVALCCGVVHQVHYASPMTCLLYCLSLQGLRHLYVCRLHHRDVGRLLVRLLPLAYGLLLVVGLAARKDLSEMIPRWSDDRFPQPGRDSRARVEKELRSKPGNHLAIVRYEVALHNPDDEWVYNAADIDRAKIVWAADMSPVENQELIDYFPDRHIWLVEPEPTPKITEYPH
jgi:hypothetical protein